ncbi:MAG: hypothetical protein ACRD96_18230, partial [Bryobacteraceae bacterium]
YWGGALATIGGALVLGALGRLRGTPRVSLGVALGGGAAILMLARPFEGFVMCLPAAAMALAKSWRRPRVVIPATAVLALAAAALGYYYWRVTGSPWRVPEIVQRQQYAVAQVFFWEPLRPEPEYRHQSIRDFFTGWEKEGFLEIRTPSGWLWNLSKKLVSAWLFFLGPALTIPLLMARRVARDRRVRPLCVILAVALIGFNLTPWFYPHYAAPIASLIFALLVQAMRHLGRAAAHRILVVTVVVIVVQLAGQRLLNPPDWPMTWYHTSAGNTARALALSRLRSTEGMHLAIVRYGRNHRAVMNEWVYNESDIDRAQVVFAREMDAESNRELIRYFAGRKVWLVEADEEPPRVGPYPSP